MRIARARLIMVRRAFVTLRRASEILSTHEAVIQHELMDRGKFELLGYTVELPKDFAGCPDIKEPSSAWW